MKFSRKQVRSVALLVAIAAVTGHLMQNGGTIAASLGPGGASTTPAALAAEVAGMAPAAMAAETMQDPPAPTRPIILTADMVPVPTMPKLPDDLRAAAVADPAAAQPVLPAGQPDAAVAGRCTPRLALTLRPDAVVRVEVEAPCSQDGMFRLTHAGVTFAVTADSTGHTAVDVPVLESPATFALAAGDVPVRSSIDVPDLAQFSRFALAAADPDLELHTFESGAGYADAGHVWRGAPGQAGATGTLVRLGVAERGQVEIYSVPVDGPPVKLNVEAEVTPTSCGRHLEAKTLGVRGGLPLDGVDVGLTMPGCDATGGFVVLGDLFPAPKLAAN